MDDYYEEYIDDEDLFDGISEEEMAQAMLQAKKDIAKDIGNEE